MVYRCRSFSGAYLWAFVVRWGSSFLDFTSFHFELRHTWASSLFLFSRVSSARTPSTNLIFSNNFGLRPSSPWSIMKFHSTFLKEDWRKIKNSQRKQININFRGGLWWGLMGPFKVCFSFYIVLLSLIQKKEINIRFRSGF